GQQVAGVFRERTRDEWATFAAEHDCCLEPVLELDEALASDLVAAREMVVELEQPGLGVVRQLGVPVKLSRTAGAAERAAPALGEHTEEVLGEAGLAADEIGELVRSGAVAGPNEAAEQETFLA
ncbi:MAG TPA: CoA transferase, partial [Solirubrobacterales bacterium]|nr:CoA transferase [Solirubrobacterales bacterium]